MIHTRRRAACTRVVKRMLQLTMVSAGPVLATATARSPPAAGRIAVLTSGICRVAQYQSVRNVI